jgi:phage/plasmid-like protein (TIGR03299 family)
MSALVETMFSVREVPWHGLSRILNEPPTSEEAIKQAGLDWEVIPEEIYVQGRKVPNYWANVRSDNGKVLGIVSNRYKIIQNKEAFVFTDSLIGEGLKYETAGSLKEGKQIWLLGRLPEIKLIDDVTIPYIVFTNSHDGKSPVKVALTPVRVVCNNTLNLALKTAQRSWSVIHRGDIQGRLEEARRTLELTDIYLKNLQKTAENMVNISLKEKDIEEIINTILPTKNDMSEKAKENVIRLRNDILYRYDKAPDLQKFKGTAWGFLNAVADHVTHKEPLRKSKTFKERHFVNIINGAELLDQTYELLAA